LTPLERSFSSNDVSNKKENKEKESKRKIGNTISMKNGTKEDLKTLKIGAQCSKQEKQKFIDLSHELKDVFAWSYKYLYGFNPSIIQHAIHIKEESKLVRKK